MSRPLYAILRQYRVLQIILTIFLCLITWNMVEWVMVTPYKDLTDWQVGVIATTLPALIAGLFAVVNSTSKKAERDDEHHR